MNAEAREQQVGTDPSEIVRGGVGDDHLRIAQARRGDAFARPGCHRL
jgi:hypothetical protein